MTLGLLSENALNDLKNGNQMRRRVAQPVKSETRNIPADLFQTQLFSLQIKDAIKNFIEKEQLMNYK